MVIVESAVSAMINLGCSINNFDTTIQWPDDNAKMEVTKIGVGIKGGFKSIDDEHGENATCYVVTLKTNDNDGTTNAIAEVPCNEETKRTRPITIVCDNLKGDAICILLTS